MESHGIFGKDAPFRDQRGGRNVTCEWSKVSYVYVLALFYHVYFITLILCLSFVHCCSSVISWFERVLLFACHLLLLFSFTVGEHDDRGSGGGRRGRRGGWRGRGRGRGSRGKWRGRGEGNTWNKVEEVDEEGDAMMDDAEGRNLTRPWVVGVL